jgi:glycosyltransferase involved in cell wall biosynthesis
LTKNRDWRHFIKYEKSDIIIINSIAAIVRYKDIVRLINQLTSDGKKVFLYCHETDYVFNYEIQNHPHFLHRFNAIKNKFTWLCVSDRQKKYLINSYGIKYAHTIYVSIPEYFSLPTSEYIKNKITKICMIGSIQPRKGFKLFSDVANEAKNRGLNFEFSWVGHITKRINIEEYDTTNFNMLGKLSSKDTYDHLKECDILFVSSVDDPMTLTVLEALKLRKKVCFYKEVGWSTLIDEFDNVKIFKDYDVNSALDAICSLNEIDNPNEFESIIDIIDNHCGHISYTVRLNMILKYTGAPCLIEKNKNKNKNNIDFKKTWTYKIGKCFTYIPGKIIKYVKH